MNGKPGSVSEMQTFFKRTYEMQKDRGKIRDFFDSSLESTLMPKRKIWQYVNEILDKDWAFNYIGPQGDEGLRMKIAGRYLHDEKLAKDFLITSGAQEALMIIIRYLDKVIGKKVRVGVEEFTYVGFRHILEENECQIDYLKLSDDGLDLDDLEKKLKRGLDLVYLIPDIQNPTGVIYSNKNRKKIAELQKKYKFWLILDLSYRDLFFTGVSKPGIEMFNKEKTFFVGSFSKTMFPALRIGWMYMPKIKEELLLIRRSIDLFQPTFLQLAMSRFLGGEYDRHLEIVRSIVKDKRDFLNKKLIENDFDKKYFWKDVGGGYYLWLSRIDGKSCKKEIKKWSKDGIITASGLYFNPSRGGSYVRLCFSRLSIAEIGESVDRMAGKKLLVKKKNWLMKLLELR